MNTFIYAYCHVYSCILYLYYYIYYYIFSVFIILLSFNVLSEAFIIFLLSKYADILDFIVFSLF